MNTTRERKKKHQPKTLVHIGVKKFGWGRWKQNEKIRPSVRNKLAFTSTMFM